MSIVIESTIENFEGKIFLPDFLTMPQVNAFNAANRKTQKAANSPEGITMWERDEMIAPGLFACIEKLEMQGQPEHPSLENFRFTPARDGDIFISFLIVNISKLVMGEEIIPNA